MRFCKFSVVSVFSNENPETPEIFKSMQKLYFLFQVFKNFFCLCKKKKFNSLNFSKTQVNQFSQTNAPRDFHCFLLNKSLPRWNFLKIFHPNGQLRPIKIAPTHLFATGMTFCKLSVVSVFSNWLFSSERKPGNAGNF